MTWICDFRVMVNGSVQQFFSARWKANAYAQSLVDSHRRFAKTEPLAVCVKHRSPRTKRWRTVLKLAA